MRVALVQVNAVVGDLAGNAGLIAAGVERARQGGAEVIVFPEMCLSGYPPEDLLLKRHFLEDCRAALEGLATQIASAGGTVLVGFPESAGAVRYNALAVLEGGRIAGVYRKACLPNYGVFDEKRYFEAGAEPCVIERGGLRIGLTICEDVWDADWLAGFMRPVGRVDVLVNASASPFHAGKRHVRERVAAACARRLGCAVVYCNLVGGQDELVFDGRSLAADAGGRIVARGRAFEEDTVVVDVATGGAMTAVSGTQAGDAGTAICDSTTEGAGEGVGEGVGDGPWAEDVVEEVYAALVLGTRDYVRKNGFLRVVIGLSGGIDSSLTAAVAVDALGAENVVGVTMPSRFNTAETISDAERTARNLGIEFHAIPIGGILDVFDRTLGAVPGWDDRGIAYENLQARIRGTILMSLSNQLGLLVLTTGNKSETAVGYSTLYGDTAGGFAVIKDVPKTGVYALSRYVNRRAGAERIPESVIERVPSAELREGQKDSDSLPDYEVLDRVLRGYVEADLGRRELLTGGLEEATVLRVIGLVDRNEYKRRQCPPGVKITPKAFGKDRRMPITNRYRG